MRYTDGRSRICAMSGLWNTNLGYGDTAVADAMDDAARRLSYAGLFRAVHPFAETAAGELLDLVAEHAGPGLERVVFATSGGACVDLAVKVMRLVGAPRSTLVVSLRNSYHGTTLGGSALTDQEMAQLASGADTRHVRLVTVDGVAELDRLMDAVGTRVAGVIVEPVQGTGTHALGADFLEHLLLARRRYGFLLAADEVATGFGRTGPMFASAGWAPDLLLLSKALTNGAAAGSTLLVTEDVAGAVEERFGGLPWGETQAGTPATCAAISAVVRRFREPEVLQAGQRLARQLDDALTSIAAPHGLVLTGRGLFRSVLFNGVTSVDVMAMVRDAFEAGVRLQPGPNGVQLVPALTMSADDLHQVTEVLREVTGAALRRATLPATGAPEGRPDATRDASAPGAGLALSPA